MNSKKFSISRFYRKALRFLMKYYGKSPRSMARYAYRGVPAYRKLYRGYFQKGQKIFDFRRLPLFTKNEVSRLMPQSFLNKRAASRVRRYAETTGSLGRPTSSFYTAWEFKKINLLFELIPEWKKVKKLSKQNPGKNFALNGIVHGYTIAGHVFGQALEGAGFITAHVGSRSTIAKPARVANTIARLRPLVIAATPTDFLSWMKIIKESDDKVFQKVVRNLKFLVSSAELTSDARSKRIEEEFSIRHLNIYGSVEGFFSVPCTCGRKHIPEIFKAEAANEELTETSEHGRGRFVFTNLARKSSPFVRYLLDDDVTISRESEIGGVSNDENLPQDSTNQKCFEGYEYSIIPHGRYELAVKTHLGRFGIRHFEELLFSFGLFADYKITLRNDNPGNMADYSGNSAIIDIEAELFSYQNINRIDISSLKQAFESAFGLKTFFRMVPMGEVYDYKAIRVSKPLWRLKDERVIASQKMPVNL